MKKKKIFVLLSDGVGFRNFAHSSFNALGIKKNFELIYWNNTPFPITDMGFSEIKITHTRMHPFTDIYKKAKVQVELNLNIKRSNDKVYDSYRFPFEYFTVKFAIKSLVVHVLTFLYSSEKGIQIIRNKIKSNERKTPLYNESFETLKKEKPSIVFCTNQRHVNTLAPLLAAKDLGIPTACFIYSWDNLPKATLVVETDFYFVWSDYMKKELMYYYPYIQLDQIFITGSPQFEMHFQKDQLPTREEFYKQHQLDFDKKYVCFSGNDVVSCPDDPKYLEDIALAVKKLNSSGHQLGVIFRKCPVDFSDRFDSIIAKYPNEIKAINPLWKPLSSMWNSVLPTKEDDIVLSSIAEYSEMVITVGSSTIFDFISHNKPCGYLKYNQQKQLNPNWDIHKCYRFVHFRSMPNQECVFWINSSDEMANEIEKMLGDGKQQVLKNAKLWFEIINQQPAKDASERIVNAIEKVMN